MELPELIKSMSQGLSEGTRTPEKCVLDELPLWAGRDTAKGRSARSSKEENDQEEN